ncbi:redoxin domain-containing protein [Nitratifractor sp.]
MGRRKRGWNLLRELLVGALLFFLLSWGINLLRAPELPDARLPSIAGETLRGSTLGEIHHRGEPLMIHFWGTWCPVCRQEASNIDRVARHYPVLSIAVNSGSAEKLREWMGSHSFSYPVLPDPDGNLARRFHIEIYPTTLIYDATGKLRFSEVGYSTTAGLLARMKWVELTPSK